jgi:hypothetical protein
MEIISYKNLKISKCDYWAENKGGRWNYFALLHWLRIFAFGKPACFRLPNPCTEPPFFSEIARLRSRCELRRGTEFSKQKYRRRGIFRKFVVAGDGIRENKIFAATALINRWLTAVLPSGFRLW